MPSILELSHEDARDFFLQSESYCNIDLPSYFNFDELLTVASLKLGQSDISSFFFQSSFDTATGKKKLYKPHEHEGVNYLFLGNKDGEYSWRPYELIHPALYVDLVHTMTAKENWEYLQQRFSSFAVPQIHCESLPLYTTDEESAKAKQIKNWWTGVEQRSLELGLQYQYTFDADISNCYGSIYTHAIAWALHTKPVAKARRGDMSLLGNKIDRSIQRMRFGQTNGIPQGSVAMDFIAEMVLGYIDTLLAEKIANHVSDDYKFIRYRDDYKVLTNNPEEGRKIIKCLSEILSDHGMKLNTDKTKQRADPILAAVKDDKLDELFIPRNKMSMQKWLLQIYVASHKHPNSGSISRLLTKYYDALDGMKKLGDFDNPKVMLSIAVNLAIKNPKSYQWGMAIISKILEFCEPSEKITLISLIRDKFDRIPNTALLDIWLQRISYKTDPNINYNEEKLTLLLRYPTYPGNNFWNSAWLKPDMGDLISETPIIIPEILNTMSETIERSEVELFKQNIPSL